MVLPPATISIALSDPVQICVGADIIRPHTALANLQKSTNQPCRAGPWSGRNATIRNISRYNQLARQRPWLSLWESCHANSVTERAMQTLSGTFGATSPRGGGKFGRIHGPKCHDPQHFPLQPTGAAAPQGPPLWGGWLCDSTDGRGYRSIPHHHSFHNTQYMHNSVIQNRNASLRMTNLLVIAQHPPMIL